MHSRYDRIVWTVIALALALIALNPWLAPGRLWAQSGIVQVDIRRIDGVPLGSKRFLARLPVVIVDK